MKATLLRLAIVGIAAASASSFMVSVVYAQVDKPRDIQALTYDYVEKQFDQEGKVTREMRSTKALRSDGSSVEVSTNMLTRQPDDTPREIRMILDLSKPARLTVYPMLKAVTTFPLDQPQADGERRQQQSCDGGATAIKSTRMGYEVVSQRPTRDIPNLPSHFPDVEVWVAPALGCTRLEETMRRDRKVVTLRQAENIKLGDPDPSLFEVPADYEELSPMQLGQRFKELFPDQYANERSCENERCQQDTRRSTEMQLRMENEYWAAQAKKRTAPPTR
jgi:hypothetical protein